MKRTIWIASACGWVCLWLSGCVMPSEVSESLLTRYHRTILDRSPQCRAGREGLDLLRPLPQDARKPLEVIQDDLTGEKGVRLSLEQAIRMALANSPEIRVVSFDPAISREEMVQAAAAFDVIVFASLSRSWTDRHQASTFGSDQTDATAAEAGLGKRNVYGGQAELKWSLSRTHDDNAFLTLNPAYESMMTFQLTQPLLRMAGKDYNLAALRVAEVSRDASYAQFRLKVEEIISQVEQIYWLLVRARGDMRIVQEILQYGQETLKKVRRRLNLDAREKLELAQTVAAVEQRRAALIEARKAVADLEDSLVRLLGDPQLNLMTGCRIVPSDRQPEVAKLTVDPADQLISALRHSPVLEQARLAIQSTEINVLVARNETLPVLNFVGSVGLQGLSGNRESAIEDMNTYNFMDYSIGLLFEYPLGNRAAKAAFRQRLLEQDKAMATMQNVADQLAVAVNEAIRQMQSNLEVIAAQDKVIRALKDNLDGLESAQELRGADYLMLLDQMLRQQQSLGMAKQTKLRARTDFRTARARLTQLTGTTLQQHQIKLIAESVAGYRPGRVRTTAATTVPATQPTP